MPAKVGSSRARPTIGTKRSGRLRSACASRGVPRVVQAAAAVIRLLRSMGDLLSGSLRYDDGSCWLCRSPAWWIAPVSGPGVAAVPLDKPGQHLDESCPLVGRKRGKDPVLGRQRGWLQAPPKTQPRRSEMEPPGTAVRGIKPPLD